MKDKVIKDMISTLWEASSKFLYYAEIHNDKGDYDKAAVNMRMSIKCAEAARMGEANEQVKI